MHTQVHVPTLAYSLFVCVSWVFVCVSGNLLYLFVLSLCINFVALYGLYCDMYKCVLSCVYVCVILCVFVFVSSNLMYLFVLSLCINFVALYYLFCSLYEGVYVLL